MNSTKNNTPGSKFLKNSTPANGALRVRNEKSAHRSAVARELTVSESLLHINGAARHVPAKFLGDFDFPGNAKNGRTNGHAATSSHEQINGHLNGSDRSNGNGSRHTGARKRKPHKPKSGKSLAAKSKRELLALGALKGVELGASAALSAIRDPAMLRPDQLLEQYDPDEPANAIARQLSVVTAGKKFLIFDDDALNLELSKAELHRLMRGFPDRSIAILNELPYQTFAVGNRPQRYTDQSPWDGLALYKGESNDGIPWMRLPRQTRRLIFIASQLLALPDLHKYAELELFRALAKAESKRKGSSFIAATRLFPAAFIQYKDYERQEHLPPLKVAVGTT